MDGVQFFTRGKAITSRWLDPSHGGIELGFPQNQLATARERAVVARVQPVLPSTTALSAHRKECR